MKYTIKILLLLAILTSVFNFVSCKENALEDSIFDTSASQDILDKTAYTFPLDTFCKAEFLEPYNLNFMYKFEDKGSDMNKNLTPAKYDKSVDLAVLSKYLWYDIYKDLAGADFLKAYSPRIIHVCGSKNYNASQGTEVLGDASGGIKINLYNVNNLDVDDIDMMNEYFFKTMHHEFSHILDQTYSHPTAFNAISNGKYDANWSDSHDSLKAGLGFVTKYASSSYSEDWAEIIANYVTRDSISWNRLLGSASYDWEEIDTDLRSLSDFTKKYGKNYRDTIGLFKEADNGENKIVRRVCKRDDAGHVVLLPNTNTLFSGNRAMTTADSKFNIPNVDWKTVQVGDKIKITADVPGSASGTSFNLINASETVVVPNVTFQSTIVTLSVEITLTSKMLDDIKSTNTPALTISGEGFTVKTIELEGTPTVQWLHQSGIDGTAVIEQKVELARQYLLDNYNVSLDELRTQVQNHTYVTDAQGHFMLQDGKLVNKLLQVQSDGRTLIEHLRDNVYKFKALQQ